MLETGWLRETLLFDGTLWRSSNAGLPSDYQVATPQEVLVTTVGEVGVYVTSNVQLGIQDPVKADPDHNRVVTEGKKRISVRVTIFAILMLLLPSSLPAAPCPELPSNVNWSQQEHWTWKEICEGREANLQQNGSAGTSAEARIRFQQSNLSQRFIETILLNEPYRSSIPRQGVRIFGARFPERIDLSHSKLEGDLWLRSSRFEDARQSGEAMNLVGAQISGHLNLEGSSASAGVNMDSLHAGALSMNYVNFPSVWLASARIGTQVNVNDATVTGRFQMTNLEVGTDLYLLNSTLTEVVLSSAKVGGRLAIEGPRSARTLWRRTLGVGTTQHLVRSTVISL